MNRRGLLGSILAAPAAVVGALRKPSGIGRFLAGTVASEITFDKPILFDLDTYEDALKRAHLGVYEMGEVERARFDALADEYAAVQKGIVGPNQALLEYPAPWFNPRLGLASRVVLPFDGGRGFPDVGEL